MDFSEDVLGADGELVKRRKIRLLGVFCIVDVVKIGLSFGCFCDFGQRSFAARSGVFLHEALFDSFVVLRLDFCHIFGDWASLEGFQGVFDVLLDFLVMGGTLCGLASGLFGGFDNRH